MNEEPVVERSREVRIGLVMYGGVTLAIYTYGASRELFDTVRGRGVYGVLKEILDADIVVDVISGTSAGGVNGVLLGRAMVTGGDFGACADLWREKGDVLTMLEDPVGGRYDGERAVPESLFRSVSVYETSLAKAVHDLGRPHPPDPSDRPSAVEEIDLFVTGTDIRGQVWTEHDSRGREVSVKDHRAVFHLKHRADRVGTTLQVRKTAFQHDDDTLVSEGLARIARATSAFPVAFQPVGYGVTKDGFGDRLDPWLRDMLRGAGDADPGARWFADGGILDNKPFGYLLPEIFRRSARRPVDRKLLYIEPDPERFFSATDRSQPPPHRVAFAALVGIPGYETIAADLAGIRERNIQIDRLKQLSKLAAANAAAPCGAGEATAYAAARAMSLVDRIADILSECHRGQVDQTLVEAMRGSLDAAMGSAGTPASFTHALDDVDPAFHLRQHFHVIYALHESMTPSADSVETEKQVLAWLYERIEVLQATLRAVDLRVRTQMKDRVGPRSEGERDSSLAALIVDTRALLQHASVRALWTEIEEAGLTPERRARVYEGAQQLAVATLTGEGDTPTILRALQASTLRHLGGPSSTWGGTFSAFPDIDRTVFPLRLLTGIHEMDHIDLVRLSPYDTGRSGPGYGGRWGLDGQEKISGDAAAHFGGFLKRSWRSNDIFWGRCDAAEILIDVLLSGQTLQPLIGPHASERRARVVSMLVELPGDTGPAQRAIESLGSLGSAEAPAIDLALGELRRVLVEARQRAIALEEVPEVAADKLRDERERAGEVLVTAEVDQERRARSDLLNSAVHARSWDGFDREVKRVVNGIGAEGLGDVSPARLVEAVTAAGLLLATGVQARLREAGALQRWSVRGPLRMLTLPLWGTLLTVRLLRERGPFAGATLFGVLATTLAFPVGILVAVLFPEGPVRWFALGGSVVLFLAVLGTTWVISRLVAGRA